MAISASFLDFAKETFAPFGEIAARRMFGGAGMYCDDLYFAIADDDVIYFKVDDITRGEFEAAGLAPFQFEMKDGSMASMSYYNAPEAIFDDEDELKRWTTLALDAARRAKKLKPKKKTAPTKATPRRKPTSLRAAKR